MMLSPVTGNSFYALSNINTTRANVELKADSAVELHTARMYVIFLFVLRKAKDDKLGWTWERMWSSYGGRAFPLTVLLRNEAHCEFSNSR